MDEEQKEDKRVSSGLSWRPRMHCTGSMTATSVDQRLCQTCRIFEVEVPLRLLAAALSSIV